MWKNHNGKRLVILFLHTLFFTRNKISLTYFLSSNQKLWDSITFFFFFYEKEIPHYVDPQCSCICACMKPLYVSGKKKKTEPLVLFHCRSTYSVKLTYLIVLAGGRVKRCYCSYFCEQAGYCCCLVISFFNIHMEENKLEI